MRCTMSSKGYRIHQTPLKLPSIRKDVIENSLSYRFVDAVSLDATLHT